LVFEDNAESNPETIYSVTKARQAASHPDWIRENLPQLSKAEIIPILITPCTRTTRGAVPSLKQVRYWHLDDDWRGCRMALLNSPLFAALDVLQGKVIGNGHKRHRHQEFLKFLRRIDREFPGNTPLHLVIDNYGTHGTVEVQAWLNKHSRFVLHRVPTSCSWLNLIERWFAELTNKRIRRDSFLSVADLTAAIEDFLAAWNASPRPFIWTATVDSIVTKLARCRQTLEQIQPGTPSAERVVAPCASLGLG
jgi:transposase